MMQNRAEVERVRKVEMIGFARIRGKDTIVFRQGGNMKYTDGFHDRKISDADKASMKLNDPRIRPDKLIKRLRGTRPWHPVLEALQDVSTRPFI